MKTRPIAAILAFFLALVMLAACSPTTPTTSSPPASASAAVATAASAPPASIAPSDSDVPDYMNETGYPIAKEMTTFTVFMGRAEEDGKWEDLELMKWLEEKTNVHFEYESKPEKEDYINTLNLLFAGGTYPDVVMPRGHAELKDEVAFSKEGFIIDVKPLIERWMPNAQGVINDFPALKAGQTAFDGGMYGFPFFYEGRGGNPHNWYMEPYWMRAAGWEDVPNTVEEMRTFMYDIKAVMDSGDYLRPEEGMYVLGYRSADASGYVTMGNVMLTSYTGAVSTLDDPWGAPDNKTIQFLVNHPGYKETVTFFRDLYRDGLVDPELFTMDASTFNARKNGAKYAMFTGSSSALEIDKIRDDPPANPGDGYACMAIRPMTSEWNDRPLINYETAGNMNYTMITDKCEKPEIIARWLDIFYNRDYDITDTETPNPLMFTRGVYGRDWSYTDDSRKFWAFLPARTDGQVDDKGNPTLIDWTYSRKFIVPGWSLPAGYYIDTAFEVSNERFVGKQITTTANVYPYCTTETQLNFNLARLTEAETDAITTKLAELKAYLKEQYGLFISGQKDIDAEWDNFVAECNRLGAEEITAIYQDVFDRWNATIAG